MTRSGDVRLSLSRLRPLHLALLGTAYWIGLGIVKLGGAVLAAWQVSRLPPNHGSISLGLTNLLLRLDIVRDNVVIWGGSASLGAIIGWVIGPPLLLAFTWRWAREIDDANQPTDAAEIDSANRSAPRLGPSSWLTDRGAAPEPRPEAKVRHPGHP
jgi:hypothetical protein